MLRPIIAAGKDYSYLARQTAESDTTELLRVREVMTLNYTYYA